jgi:hypothetical protein
MHLELWQCLNSSIPIVSKENRLLQWHVLEEITFVEGTPSLTAQTVPWVFKRAYDEYVYIVCAKKMNVYIELAFR